MRFKIDKIEVPQKRNFKVNPNIRSNIKTLEIVTKFSDSEYGGYLRDILKANYIAQIIIITCR